MEDEKTSFIPRSMGNNVAFNLDQPQFIDSLQFLNSSFKKVANNLLQEDLKGF